MCKLVLNNPQLYEREVVARTSSDSSQHGSRLVAPKVTTKDAFG